MSLSSRTPLPFDENLELYKREIAEGKIVMESMPPYVGLVLTTRCNLRCIMCERVRKSKDLPEGYWEKVKPMLPYVTDLNWQGGEAFFVPEFEGYFEEAARYPRVFQDITTSGTLVTPRWAQRFAQSQVHLTFSIDSVVPATYELIRKGAEWEVLMQGLAYIKESEARSGARIPRLMHSVIMNENYGEVEKLLAFAHEQGFYMLILSPCTPYDAPEYFLSAERFQAHRAEVDLLQSRLKRMSEKAKLIGLRYTEKLSTLIESRRRDIALRAAIAAASQARLAQALASGAGSGRGEGEGAGTAPEPAVQGPAGAPVDSWSCQMPWQGLFVNAELDGNIYPDCFCVNTPLGNIAETDLLSAWNNERMQEYRRRVRERRLEGWCIRECTTGQLNPREHFRHPEFLPAGMRAAT